MQEEDRMNSEDQVYRELQKHLDKTPEGFPATDSGAEIRILKKLFTQEEAQIATRLPILKPEPVRSIYHRVRRAGMKLTLEELQQHLDRMLYKGTILAYREGYRETRYQNAGPLAGGIYDFQVDRLTDDLVHDFEQFHSEYRRKPPRPGARSILPLRTIPVQSSIPLPSRHLTSTYEDARQLVNNAEGPIALANCICRQSKDLHGQSCRYTDLRESCLQIGKDHARQYVDMGIARYITREEALQVLEKAEKDGLILQPENSQRPEAICCCCGDCCALLTMVAKSPRPAALYAANYYVEVKPELCNGCQACVTRCHLGARFMANGIAAVNLDRCIGCGNCVSTCKPGATRLVQKVKKQAPPRDKTAMNLEMISTKQGKWHSLKLRIKMRLGLKV
jgi:electron transport complex protein RnfB